MTFLSNLLLSFGTRRAECPNRTQHGAGTAALILLVITLGSAAFAQSSLPLKSVSVPPIEDRELYYSFFNYHQGLVNSTQAAKATNPQNAAQLDQQMAALLQVDVSELPTVVANTQQVTQGYVQLVAAGQAGVSGLPKGSPVPTPAQLASINEFRRARLTVEAVLALYQQLSTASWNGLHSYIVGTYKNTIYKPQ
jgi:hypothetical protein